jgi:hypothetical protein
LISGAPGAMQIIQLGQAFWFLSIAAELLPFSA